MNDLVRQNLTSLADSGGADRGEANRVLDIVEHGLQLIKRGCDELLVKGGECARRPLFSI